MTAVPQPWSDRDPLIDGLKAVACQLIVWHHLAFYGPMSDHARALAPALMDALAQHGRLAVAVFMVVAGFLAAKGLDPQRMAVGRAGWHGVRASARLVFARYLRLAGPLVVLLVIAVAANALADRWMDHASISAFRGVSQTLGQVLVHVLLLQDLLGVEALSAGIWYVAIDLQLYAMLVLVLAVTRQSAASAQQALALASVAVLALVVLALFVFNLDARWEVWGVYFFAAYGLGVLVAWWGPHKAGHWALLGLAALVLVALAWAWRSRLAVAAAVAGVLAVSVMWRPWAASSRQGVMPWLSQHSYAIFLVHFPVCLVVNAAFARWVVAVPVWQGLGLLLAWALSLVAAGLFHRWVERPWLAWVARWALTRRDAASSSPSSMALGGR